MAVNGVEIQAGQVWITRKGEEAYVIEKDGHDTYPFNISRTQGGTFDYSVTRSGQEFQDEVNDDDLVRLKNAVGQEQYRDINGIPLKIGDRVRVSGKPGTDVSIRTPEYSNSWTREMDSVFNDGNFYKITSIGLSGVYMTESTGCGFPAWVLEKVEDKFQETLDNVYNGDAVRMARAYFKE